MNGPFRDQTEQESQMEPAPRSSHNQTDTNSSLPSHTSNQMGAPERPLGSENVSERTETSSTTPNTNNNTTVPITEPSSSSSAATGTPSATSPRGPSSGLTFSGLISSAFRPLSFRTSNTDTTAPESTSSEQSSSVLSPQSNSIEHPLPEGTPEESPEGSVNLPGAHSFRSITPPRTTERTADNSQGRPDAPPYSIVGNTPHSLIQELREQNGVVHINFVDFDPNSVGNMPPGLNLMPQTTGEDIARTMQIFVDEHAHAQLHGMGFHTDFVEVRPPSSSRAPGGSESSSSPPPSRGGPIQRDSPMPDTEPEARQVSPDEARREQEDPLLQQQQPNSNSQQQRRRYDRFSVEDLARHPGASFQEGDDPEEYMRLRMIPRVEPMYFFAFHEEDLAPKASERALMSLRRVPLAELLDGDRECSICYEPMTEYSGPTPDMNAAAEPGPPPPPESNESGEGTGVQSNTHEWDPEDHSPLAMPVCGHVFGKACLRSWLGSAASCPICRRGIDAETSSRQLRFEHTIPFRLTPTERIRLNQDNTPFRGPTDPAAFETEVTEMLNSFRGAQVLENSEQRNMAFVRIIEAVMRQVAQRVAPDNPHAANEAAASATSFPENSSTGRPLGGTASTDTSNETSNASTTENTTGSIPIGSNSAETNPTNTPSVTFSSIPESRTESSAASADPHIAQGPSLFRDRGFRLPENAVPSLAELRARQSEIMRQALQSAQSGIAQLSREHTQQTPHGQSSEQSQGQSQAQVHSEGQPREQPIRPAFTMQFHQPIVIPNSRIHFQAMQSPGMPNEGILNTLRQQFPMFRRSSSTSQENTDRHQPSENSSGHNQPHGDSQMAADGDELGSEERRSGPSRRTAFRRHPYPRNDAA